MKNERKEKIRSLKNQILVEQDALVESIKAAPSPEEVTSLTEEQQKEKKNLLQADIAKRKGMISSLKDELKHVRMNKYMSKFFEWMPTPPNRKMMRMARKLKRI